MPVQGWTEVSDWVGFIPFEDMPKVLDPGSGRLVNANNRPMPLDYPWPIEGDWDAEPGPLDGDRLAQATPQDRRDDGRATAGLGLADGSTTTALDAGEAFQAWNATGR